MKKEDYLKRLVFEVKFYDKNGKLIPFGNGALTIVYEGKPTKPEYIFNSLTSVFGFQ